MVNGPPHSLIAERRDQILPVLGKSEIRRIRAFGEPRRYSRGERLFAISDDVPGMFVLLKGKVVVRRRDALGHAEPLIELSAGMFLAELGQLAGQPALVDADAESDVEALLIPRERFRELIIAEGDLGERIMRALILRRVLLIDAGAGGPVLVGPAADAAMVRLQNFLMRNAFPHQLLDPDRDADAQSLLDRFHVRREDLPIVICPQGEVLRNPSVSALARCFGLLVVVESPVPLHRVVVVGQDDRPVVLEADRQAVRGRGLPDR